MRDERCEHGRCGHTSPSGSFRHHQPSPKKTSRHLEEAAAKYIIRQIEEDPRSALLDALDEREPLTSRQLSDRVAWSERRVREILRRMCETSDARRVRFKLSGNPNAPWQIGYLRLPPESLRATE